MYKGRGVKIIKNEVSCRDDTMLKTVDIRKHCKVCRVESMQQSSATPKNKDVGRGLRGNIACSQPYLTVLSCNYSFWRSVISSFLKINFLHLQDVLWQTLQAR